MASNIHWNGNTLTIEVEQIPINTFGGMWEDPDWSYTDPAGHVHTYDGDMKLRTAEYVITEEWWDSDGEEYTDGEYQCVQCGAKVEPGQRSEPWTHYIKGASYCTLNGEEIPEDEAWALYWKWTEEYYKEKK